MSRLTFLRRYFLYQIYPTVATARYGAANKNKMPLLRPFAVVSPLLLFDATVAAHCAHCALTGFTLITIKPNTMKNNAVFKPAFMPQI